MKAVVMLPTYNEILNIKPLVEEILSLNSDILVVVVDDNSPDGTGKIAEELTQKNPGRIFVIHRYEKKGRGPAGIAGLKFCLTLPVNYIIEMDADFSHDPKYIPIFLEKIKKADVVLGSRFVKGGSDSKRHPFRTILSILSGYVFRAILGLKLKDIGSGFKCYRKEVLANLNFDKFVSYGIAVSMESIFRIAKKGFKILEVPIVFAERKAGYSKLTYKDFFEPPWVSLRLVWELGRMKPDRIMSKNE